MTTSDIKTILENLKIKCSLGYGVRKDGYFILAHTETQGMNWCKKLNKVGYKTDMYYNVDAYVIVFK